MTSSFFLVQSIRQRGSGWFVDDAQYFQPSDLAGVFGGIALSVVEICRHGDDRLGHRLTQIGLRIFALILPRIMAEISGGNIPPVHDHAHIAIRCLGDLVGNAGNGALDLGVVELCAP
jgi:hypothetical protein